MVNLAGYASNPEGNIGIILYERIKRYWALWLALAIAIPMALYFLMSSLLYRFESQGLLLVKQNLTQYKAESPAFYDDALLRQYLTLNNAIDSPAGKFLTNALSERFLSKQVALVMPYGKNDLAFLNLKDNENLTSVGLDLTIPSRLSGTEAAARLRLLAGFLTDTMLRQTLTNDVRRANMQALEDKQTLDNLLIQNGVKQADLTERLARTKDIAARYPDAAKLEQHQLLSTNGAESARFLSPMSQMIGIESEIASTRADAERLKRRIAQNDIALRFYDAFNETAKPTLTGSQLLQAYLNALKAFFGDAEIADDMTREVRNKLMLPVQRINAQNIDAPRFSSGPTTPANPSGPPSIVLMALSVLAGLLFATALTLLVDVARQRKTHTV
ncbi:hypothetical protein PPN31114_01297 [Pandoraea pneumonica]|uniref:Polysaccharide chain length determinant N-terminal domain-containing protein n=1 Tax=Pandoraea pneumonica TaxID=2508299 RepID=A0A5E4T7P2_9BURK|nr:hypothetical protein [Pandoraea pneumonica]VVD84110.1 hypothetical protein PPN31114_01297 [Pandoraea pneumonica]